MFKLNIKKIIFIIILLISILFIFNYFKRNDNKKKNLDKEIKKKIEYSTIPNRNNISMKEYYQRGIYPSTYKLIVLGE